MTAKSIGRHRSSICAVGTLTTAGGSGAARSEDTRRARPEAWSALRALQLRPHFAARCVAIFSPPLKSNGTMPTPCRLARFPEGQAVATDMAPHVTEGPSS